MNAQKLTPESLGCFKQVADVIGEQGAREELKKVIDHPDDLIEGCHGCRDTDGTFLFSRTAQGFSFWDSIRDGEVPEGYTPPENPQNQSQESSEKSEPKFGDVLHINGEPFVFIKSSPDHYYTTINQEGVVRECDAEMFDEYAPNPYQEQRERILKRWKGKSLDNSQDTEVCIAEIRVSDLIDFVQENLLAES